MRLQAVSILALSACSALGLTINTPTGAVSGGRFNITWNSTASDSEFSIELVHQSFNSALAIADGVNPVDENITVSIGPVPPGDGYALEFVNVTNINQVFAISGDFIIAAAPNATSTSSSGKGTSTASSAPSSISSSLMPTTSTNSHASVMPSPSPSPSSFGAKARSPELSFLGTVVLASFGWIICL
ncbi:hypothetical protein FB45DRAFT_76047 [Roridomyces roridus]|uniref:Yeast cell wall synthesis Kre9/Knh1-like N-terminal domain-containing protein n=1 Tax=Roridomyces roridus TaxID=1738132 RepID=A0AAD7BNZ5_9AGAR|nr:hypothetical protein FB45DRAFT_76047 [Roridomyces roridus]